MSRELDILRGGMATAPVDVAGIIRDIGIRYAVVSMPREQSGAIERIDDSYTISVNAHESYQRQRFTAAHELAHYLLHRDLLKAHGSLSRHNDSLFDGVENPDKPFKASHEVEANRLAAEILMPRDSVSAAYNSDADNASDLAKKFGVSLRAMEIRLKILGLRPERVPS